MVPILHKKKTAAVAEKEGRKEIKGQLVSANLFCGERESGVRDIVRARRRAALHRKVHF